MRKRTRSSVIFDIIVFLVIFSLSFAFWLNESVMTFSDFRKSSWVQTSGRIVSKKVENRRMRGGDDFHPVITYQYSDKKSTYTNDVLSVEGDRGFERAAQASHSVEKYSVGNTITVWYDPDFPFLSAVDISGSRGMLGFILATFQLLIVTCIVLVNALDIRKGLKSSPQDEVKKYTLEP